jgi:hypothetical protein
VPHGLTEVKSFDPGAPALSLKKLRCRFAACYFTIGIENRAGVRAIGGSRARFSLLGPRE